MRPHVFRRRPTLLAAGLLGAAMLALIAVFAVGGRSLGLATGSQHAPSTPSSRRIVIALDGLSWDAFTVARQRGLFKRFGNSGAMISTYPSMSHPAWSEIMGVRRVLGRRATLRTIEPRWFDLDAMRIADDPRQVVARVASPYFYQRGFDEYLDPLIEPLLFLPGKRLFDREIRETEEAIVSRDWKDHLVIYLGGPDASAHTHLDELFPYLTKLDAALTRAIDTLQARGEQVDMWLVSDHGNAGAFVEGERERLMMTVNLNDAIERAGLVKVDTGSLTRPDQVAVVTLALASMMNVYMADLSHRRALAESAMADSAVDMVTWLEAAPANRHVVILGRGRTEAHLHWRGRQDSLEYAYERIAGDPLQLGDGLSSAPGALRWIPDARMRAATVGDAYPDAAFRIVRSATKQVENAPDLIINLRDGYCWGGDMGSLVHMVRTHGSLGRHATLGVVASTAHAVPPTVRAEEVSGVVGLSPDSLFRKVEDLKPHNPKDVLRVLARAGGRISTGKSDESSDLAFRRRAKPIVISMDYLRWDLIREIINAGKEAKNPSPGPSLLDRVRTALKQSDIVGGVKNNVDTLLALADSLDPSKISDRVKEAENRLRGIPQLAPLVKLRDEKTDTLSRGQGARARMAGMALWTLPYFIDAALDAPERDSIADPRDLSFASRWFGGLQDHVLEKPSLLLGDSALPSALFAQVFAERKLWHAVDPATIPMLYDATPSDVAVVYVPGIYGELFDDEIWSRGLHALRERMGMRIISAAADGRCATEVNAQRVIQAMRDDTKRRIERGYGVPRYLIIGYSKGGLDAIEALRMAPGLARRQVAALVTIASPLRGSVVAERADVPAGLVKWAVRSAPPVACDTMGASKSLWPATRAAYWSAHEEEVAGLTRYFSLSLASDMTHAHPWMKITKRIGQFGDENDGVVSVRDSHFPASIPAMDLGTIDGDHIAGRLASSFPQEALLESIVLTLDQIGALGPAHDAQWFAAIDDWRSVDRGTRAHTRAVAFSQSLRTPTPLPGGSTGWSPDRTFRTMSADGLAESSVRDMTPERNPAGIVMQCDQKDFASFRREYEFLYDASNGGSENDLRDGFSIVADNGSSTGRACRLATYRTAIKVTTVAFRFRPMDYPRLSFRLRVEHNVKDADVTRAHHGGNDAAIKIWLVTRDMRPGQNNNGRLIGYSWRAPDSRGVVPAENALLENSSSRRHLVVTTLPEAWQVAVGSPASSSDWITIDRDLAADFRRAYPGVPLDAIQVVGITIQSDSDETKGETAVLLDWLKVQRAPGQVAKR